MMVLSRVIYFWIEAVLLCRSLGDDLLVWSPIERYEESQWPIQINLFRGQKRWLMLGVT